MCSRYYIDSDIENELEKVVNNADQQIGQNCFAGDIRPTDVAPVIEKTDHGLKLSTCKWGYPLAKGKNLVINARVETVLDKPAFQNGILYHRILIPASGFYEWNQLKENTALKMLSLGELFQENIFLLSTLVSKKLLRTV